MAVDGGGVVAVGRRGGRVEIELAEGARAQAFDLGSRFVIDVEARANVDERVGTASRLVVIDPGHGGDDFGARFDGLKEAQLVLDLSERAARIVARRLPSSRVVLTRTRDEIVGLEQRAAFANAVGADLFVSVHLNAADEPVRVGGVTTFVLDVTDDRQALRLAARENGTPVAEVTGIQRLLARVHRADQVERSRRLAEHVHAATLAGGRRVLPDLPDRGVKSAVFYVLVGARMPAVLLEASFLTKPEEAEALRSETYREALAGGIAEGIVRYVAELDERAEP
jgi:N-acetylmuramoyl-L-alanine amidase